MESVLARGGPAGPSCLHGPRTAPHRIHPLGARRIDVSAQSDPSAASNSAAVKRPALPTQPAPPPASKPQPAAAEQPASLVASAGPGQGQVTGGASSPATPSGPSPQAIAAQATQQGNQSDEYETVYETETVTEEVEVQHASQHGRFGAAASTAHAGAAGSSSSRAGAHGALQVTSVGAFQTPGLHQPALGESLQTTVHGWVVAASMLCAIRMSRDASDMERLDVRALQARQAESRVQSAELRALRAAYLEQERVRREEEAAKRLEEAKRRAAEEEAERAVREAAEKAEAAREAERMRVQAEAARKAFLESESRLAAELAARTEAEKRMLADAEARKKAEEERLRREEEEARKRAAAEAAARYAAEVAAREAEAKALAEEKARVRAMQTRYLLVLEGTATAQPALPNTFTTVTINSAEGSGGAPAQLQRLARFQTSLKLGLTGEGGQWAPQGSASSGSSGNNDVSESSSSQGTVSGGGQQQQQAPAQESLGLKAHQQQATGAYESLDSAVDGASELAGQAADPLSRELWSRLAADFSAPGRPAALMDELELEHWRRVTVACCEVAARLALCQVAPLAGSQPLSQPFRVEVRRAALPRGQPSRVNGRLATAATFVGEGRLEEAVGLLNRVIEDEEEMLRDRTVSSTTGSTSPSSTGGMASANGGMDDELASLLAGPLQSRSKAGASGSGGTPQLPPFTMHALVYAHFLDRAVAFANSQALLAEAAASQAQLLQQAGSELPQRLSQQASQQTDVVALQKQLQGLAKYQLEQATKRAGLDELAPTAKAVAAALGPVHPVARIMADIADRNASPATKARAELRRQQAELDVAAALLKQQDPRPLRLDPSDPTQRQSLTPVPERMWALRNVANGMVRFGDSSKMDEAVRMLGQACDLAQEQYGPSHPTCLAPLLDHQTALEASLALLDENAPGAEEQEEELLAARERVTERIIDVVTAIGDRYRDQKDTLSVVILYEAALKELDMLLPRNHPAMNRLQRQGADLASVLGPAEARVATNRRTSTASLLKTLSREFTPDLGVYSATKRPGAASRLEQWNRGLPLAPLR